MDKYLEDLISQEIENTVIVDFDGTIIKESRELLFNFQDEPPLKGVIGGLQELKDNGFRVKIWSCRTSSLYPLEFRLMQRKMIEEYLKKYKIPYDTILVINKPFSLVYLDSRCLSPNWEKIVDQINDLKLKSKKRELKDEKRNTFNS